MLPPIIYQDGHHISGRDSPSLPSLVIDTNSETVLGELPYEEEGDATKDFLDASRILRGYVHHPSNRFGMNDVHPISNFQIAGIRVW